MKKFISLILIYLFFSLVVLAQRGKDGTKIISTTEQVNAFTVLTANATAGDTVLSVSSSNLNSNFSGNLSQGDLVMIYQVQGASIDDSVAGPVAGWSKLHAKWGQIIDYGNTGNYEFVQVKNVPSTTGIVLDCALMNSYTSAGNVLVIRVPRYASLTINAGGVLTTSQWNLSSGGVLAVEVEGLTVVNGSIDASSLGFRGGIAQNSNQASVFGGLRF